MQRTEVLLLFPLSGVNTADGTVLQLDSRLSAVLNDSHGDVARRAGVPRRVGRASRANDAEVLAFFLPSLRALRAAQGSAESVTCASHAPVVRSAALVIPERTH